MVTSPAPMLPRYGTYIGLKGNAGLQGIHCRKSVRQFSLRWYIDNDQYLEHYSNSPPHIHLRHMSDRYRK